MSEIPKTTLTTLTLSLPSTSTSTPAAPSSESFIHRIANLLTPSECAAIISEHQKLIPSNVTPGTKRDREQFDDEELAGRIWGRLEEFYGGDRIKDGDGQVWVARGINARFRLCRYGPGGRFSPHQDGRRLESVGAQSFMTVNMYLNTVPPSWKGATRALTSPDSNPPCEVLGSVQPVMGTAAVFRDCLWHDGEELVRGEKYLLRTDLMYEREVQFDFERIYGDGGLELDDEGKGRKALTIAEGLEDAGKSGEAVRWYKKAFKLCPGLERGG